MLLPQLARKCMVYVLIGVMHLGFVPLSVFADGAVSWTINATSTIVEKSDLTATNYTCDPAFSACKFNIKFSDIRPSIKSHHNCIIDFGFTTQVRQNDCDPTEVQVPVGSWPVTIIVTNIDTSVEVLRLRPFTVTRAPEISIPEVFTPIDFSPISVTVDSGLDATNTCKTETCQVNLTLNPLPSNDTVCVWDFGPDATTSPANLTKCDPGYVNFPKDATVTLIMTDTHFATNIATRILDIKKLPITPPDDTTGGGGGSHDDDGTNDGPEFTRLDFTSLAVVIDSGLDDTLTCKTETCQTNFHIDAPVGALCHWDFGVGISAAGNSEKCNPGYVNFANDTALIVTVVDPHFSDNTFSQTLQIKKRPTIITDIGDDSDGDDGSVSMPLDFSAVAIVVDSGLDGTGKCRTDICQVNFSSIVPAGAVCQWDFGTGVFSTVDTDKKCNPGYVKFALDTSIVLTVTDPDDATNTITKVLQVLRPNFSGGGGASSTLLVGGGSSNMTTLDVSSSHIVVQSGLDTASTCKTTLCQVNFLAEVPEGSLCEWDFGSGIFETPETDKKCNPGFVQFATQSVVSLRVFDPKNRENSVTRDIIVYRRISSGAAPVIAAITLQGKQNKNHTFIDDGIRCNSPKNEKCSLNFTAENSTGAESYFWDFGDGTTSTKKNPPSHLFPRGRYTVNLIVRASGNSDRENYTVEVTGDEETPEKQKCTNCDTLAGLIRISRVLPNPPHTDTVEWIEISNTSIQSIDLSFCEISDDSETFALSGVLGPDKIIRLRQASTGLSLGNKKETLTLKCGAFIVDTFSWDFPVPSGYILRREIFERKPTKVFVEKVIDGDTIDVILEGKKTRVRLLGIDTPETVHPRKEVQKWGQEASDFTKKTLGQAEVWMTFDADPIDHYGRTLAYIWRCEASVFVESQCTLFNARVIREGYGRMERRFGFMYFDEFDDIESGAKKAKIGLWSDAVATSEMNAQSREEKESRETEQEKDYLELQKELLEMECEEGINCEKKEEITWKEVTKNLTTLNVSVSEKGKMRISGRSWDSYPLSVSVFQGDKPYHSDAIVSDITGNYLSEWYPREVGEYRVLFTIREQGDGLEEASICDEKDSDEGASKKIPSGERSTQGNQCMQQFVRETSVTVEAISDHFAVPLSAEIVIQGKESKNRFSEAGIWYCRSRGSCSVNLTSDSNRSAGLSYIWTLPDGSQVTDKNPKPLNIPYGKFTTTLTVTDLITGETITKNLNIIHTPLPKQSKKPSVRHTSQNFTLDLKDLPNDIGGGAPAPEEPQKNLLLHIILALLISIIVGFMFRKHPIAKP